MRDGHTPTTLGSRQTSWLAPLGIALLLSGCGGGGAGGGDAATNANLAQLRLSVGTLTPAFDPATTTYAISAGSLARSLAVTPTTEDAGARVTVNDVAVWSGASSSVSLAEGDTVVRVEVTAPSGDRKTYSITATRQSATSLSQSAYLKASNGGAFDFFGRTLAIDGDTLAVGAPQEDSAANGVNNNFLENDDSAGNSGAVYVMVRANGAWSQQAYVKASTPGSGDYFGSSVALSGDTLVVGASGEDSALGGVNRPQSNNDAVDSGAAYVFTRVNGVWSQQAYLKASNPGVNDRFGASVAVFGDTLVVGAPGEDSMASGINGDQTNNAEADSGAAYVFTRVNGVWSQQAYVKASTPDAADVFGSSVALYGNTLAVGALGEGSNSASNPFNNDEPLSGAVYVYLRVQNSWMLQAYLKASNPEAGDNFGFSISLDGDTLAVGALNEDSIAAGVDGDQENNGAGNSGAVYIMTRQNNAWTHQAYVKASNPGVADNFGYSVTIAGDTLAVGALAEDSAARGINPTPGQADNSLDRSGAAYLFTRDNGVWAQEAYLKASNTGRFDSFGGAVAIAGDTLAIGAHEEASADGTQENDGAVGTGAVYIFQ
ncbi:MAG: cadherin-like beta sandwich domain-containing protein [Nitrospirota bacterium]